MSGFDALYRQTVTLFNRVKDTASDDALWYPTVLKNVHLVVDKSFAWDMNGGHVQDNVRLHVRYVMDGGEIMVAGKPWYEPKAYRKLVRPEDCLTFAYGDADTFDFFMEGIFNEYPAPISDFQYSKKGFYNYMNANYDNVFAIASVSKYNIIPHFEIMGR